MNIFGYEIKKPSKIKTKGASRSFSSLASGNVKINADTFFQLYKRNADIRQAINKISLWVSRNGIIIRNRKGDEVQIEELDKKVEDMFTDQTFQKFKKELFKQYLLSGELYITNNENIKGETVGFQILDSRTIRKQLDSQGNITRFTQYTKVGSRSFNREELAYFKFEDDTDNQVNGMGLLEGIVWDALSDLEGSKRNYYFFENNATPDGMILLNDEMGEEEQQNAIEQFSRSYKGSENAHKMMAVGGIKDIKTLSLTHKDMDFINQRKLTTDKVSSALGVPKNILGYVENVNLANGDELKKEFIDGTIRPYEEDFKFIINALIVKFKPELANKYILHPDGETLEEREKIEEAQRQDIKTGVLTIDEVRQERGLDEFNTDQSKNPIISNNMIMLEDMIMNNGVEVGEI